MLQTFVDLFLPYGYAAVFGVLILCGLGLPVPEDLSIVSGGIISGLGYTNVYLMLAVCLAGVMIGDSCMFFIGRYFGIKFLDRKIVGRIITPARYKLITDWLAHYGKGLLFAARFMPGLRSAIFLTAGILKFVRFPVFFLIDLSAAVISVPLWICFGYFGASNRQWVMEWVARSHIAILVAILLFALVIIVHTIVKFHVRKLEKEYVNGKNVRNQNLEEKE